MDVAREFGLGSGTVAKYTERVIEALVSLAPKWLKWPGASRRNEIGQEMREEGFPGCVGFIDGTTIPLSQKPAMHGAAYFDREKRYSINLQVICDVDERIIGIDVGWPGATADSTVYKSMDVYIRPKQYFSPGQFLLADSAYPLSTYCIPAFKSPAASLPENHAFNYCISRSCVRNEHCIRVLKTRWSSLGELRGHMRNDKEAKTMVQWVTACYVLHNMLASLGDAWQNLPGEEGEEGEAYGLGHGECTGTATQTTIPAMSFRENLKKAAMETNLEKGVLVWEEEEE